MFFFHHLLLHLKSVYYLKSVFGQFQIVPIFPILRESTLMFMSLFSTFNLLVFIHVCLQLLTDLCWVSPVPRIIRKTSCSHLRRNQHPHGWLFLCPKLWTRSRFPASLRYSAWNVPSSLNPGSGMWLRINAGHSVLTSTHVPPSHYLTIRNPAPNHCGLA